MVSWYWLTDGLCGNDTDRLTDLDAFTVGHIGTVAVRADADVARQVATERISAR